MPNFTVTISGLSTFSSATAANTDVMMVGVNETTYKVARPFAYQLATYTVATVPTASLYPRCVIYVSNLSPAAGPAYSDGTSWRTMSSGAIIS